MVLVAACIVPSHGDSAVSIEMHDIARQQFERNAPHFTGARLGTSSIDWGLSWRSALALHYVHSREYQRTFLGFSLLTVSWKQGKG